MESCRYDDQKEQSEEEPRIVEEAVTAVAHEAVAVEEQRRYRYGDGNGDEDSQPLADQVVRLCTRLAQIHEKSVGAVIVRNRPHTDEQGEEEERHLAH